jgi:hypothetical protein
VDLLKVSSGAWISDRPAIGSCFVNHFKTLFTSSSPTISDDMLNLFDNSVLQKKMNLFVPSLQKMRSFKLLPAFILQKL